jgi:hypothetical protein
MRLCEMADAERARLLEVPTGRSPWRPWGPSLAERAWGTVREDYRIPPGATWSRSTSTSTGDTGPGVDASHQTGWTGLVANLIIASPS